MKKVRTVWGDSGGYYLTTKIELIYYVEQYARNGIGSARKFKDLKSLIFAVSNLVKSIGIEIVEKIGKTNSRKFVPSQS